MGRGSSPFSLFGTCLAGVAQFLLSLSKRNGKGKLAQENSPIEYNFFSIIFVSRSKFDLVYLLFIESEDEHEDIDDSSDPDQHQS